MLAFSCSDRPSCASHPLVDHVVCPFLIGRADAELTAELGGLEIDIVMAEKFAHLVEDILAADRERFEQDRASYDDRREMMVRAVLARAGGVVVIEGGYRKPVKMPRDNIVSVTAATLVETL